MAEAAGVSLQVDAAEPFLEAGALADLQGPVAAAARALTDRTCPGADRLGWRDLPARAGDLAPLLASAARARRDSEFYVVVGIGGSYLGARAVIEALGARLDGPQVLFAGTDLCSRSLAALLARLRDHEVRVCAISKSGGTLEPALAFRFLRELLRERYGREEAGRRVVAVTGADGTLRRLAAEEGYETFAVPEDVGGRFSVLTPVGLLPLAVAGVDVEALLDGAARMRQACLRDELRDSPAHLYAAVRHALGRRGYRAEFLSTFHCALTGLQEWWRQLFGESEGKDGRGLQPATALFTTDLHSMGQYLQEGPRDLIETFLHVRRPGPDLAVPADPPTGSLDGLDYLAGRSLDEINRRAYEGTRQAHRDGGVPCLDLVLERLDERSLGALIYLFEEAVAVSGLLLGVNPFDQPGVERYKREMFRRLGRP